MRAIDHEKPIRDFSTLRLLAGAGSAMTDTITAQQTAGKRRNTGPMTISLLLVGVSMPTHGGSMLTTVAAFSGDNGEFPLGGLVADAAGNLYGTTSSGGLGGSGTVFEIPAGTDTVNTLASFDGGNGASPAGSLVVDNGNLYGTTQSGGLDDAGTVFEVAAGSNAITTLVTFNGTNGSEPTAGLTEDSNGNLFGTTYYGGANGGIVGGYGTVFEVSAGTNTLTTLASFNGDNGANPHGGVIIDSKGNLYGTAANSGANQDGTVFTVAAGSNTISTVASFNGYDGKTPYGSLVADAQGDIYGTTVYGGLGYQATFPNASGFGTVFEIPTGSNGIENLASFASLGLSGASVRGGGYPQASLLIDADGNIFGTASGLNVDGGSDPVSNGALFELAAGNGVVTTLATFDDNTGVWPAGDLLADVNGNLYGTTQYTGPGGAGTVFELSETGFVVPEPAAVSMAGLGLIGLMRRKRKT